MSDDSTHITPAGELLASVPGLLGFIPERSVIILTYDADGTPAASMRHDLELTGTGRPAAQLQRVFDELGDIVGCYRPRALAAVIVDDRYPPDDRRYRDVLACAAERLAPGGVVNLGFVVDDCREGATWHTVWRSADCFPLPAPPAGQGTLADPHTSPAALSRAVRTGRRVLSSRSEMITLLDPRPHCESRHRASAPPVEAAASDDVLLRRMVEAAREGSRIRSGTIRFDCDRVHGLDLAVRRIPVRDAVMALAVTELRDGAERLYRELATRLDGTGRAAAATLLAHLHYVAGEGAYAGVALDCALTADPEYRLAGLLDRALRCGMPPSELAEIVDSSVSVADDLGVPLPPRRQSFCTNSE